MPGPAQPASTAPPPGDVVAGAALRGFMRSWPGGVAVVTSALGDQPVGCTVNSFISVSLRPPLVLVSLAHASRTLATIAVTGTFGVNVLTGGQRDLAELFATGVGDRFAAVRYRWDHGVPLLEDTSAAAICRVDRTVEAADHTLLLGRPQWCSAVGDAGPLVFAGRSYWTLANWPDGGFG